MNHKSGATRLVCMLLKELRLHLLLPLRKEQEESFPLI